jgi:hypothetical protein
MDGVHFKPKGQMAELYNRQNWLWTRPDFGIIDERGLCYIRVIT